MPRAPDRRTTSLTIRAKIPWQARARFEEMAVLLSTEEKTTSWRRVARLWFEAQMQDVLVEGLTEPKA